MSEENNKKTCSIYTLADEFLPRQPWYPSTDDMAEQIADLIVEHGYTVKYNAVMKPLIDAAVLRDPYTEEEELRNRLKRLRNGEWIILLNQQCCPYALETHTEDDEDYAELLTYDSCVWRAEHFLSSLLRCSRFCYHLYMTYLGAAFAIARADHPDWTFKTFVERFMKDVVDRMTIRTKKRD